MSLFFFNLLFLNKYGIYIYIYRRIIYIIFESIHFLSFNILYFQISETIQEEEDEESEMMKDMDEFNNMKYKKATLIL